jgi:putative tryptophan/tyrosine transport system substrate-binding protein
MRRRHFIALLGSLATSWSLAARAQQATSQVIGFLHQASSNAYANLIAIFKQGLSETGFAEPRNVSIEFRWGDDQYNHLPELAADLVRRQARVIVAAYLPASLAAKNATTTVPIVFISGTDPVASGLVSSLNRPGGNITGITVFTSQLVAKRLEVLQQLVPGVTTIAALVNPHNQNAQIQLKELDEASSTLNKQLQILKASNEGEITAAFTTIAEKHIGALLVGADSLFTGHAGQIVELSARYKVPAIYVQHDLAAIGGLVSYGPSFSEAYRQAGFYAGRILRGENVADLPVQQSTKVELVINLKTAKALGLTIPLPLLGRADEVIE